MFRSFKSFIERQKQRAERGPSATDAADDLSENSTPVSESVSHDPTHTAERVGKGYDLKHTNTTQHAEPLSNNQANRSVNIPVLQDEAQPSPATTSWGSAVPEEQAQLFKVPPKQDGVPPNQSTPATGSRENPSTPIGAPWPYGYDTDPVGHTTENRHTTRGSDNDTKADPTESTPYTGAPKTVPADGSPFHGNSFLGSPPDNAAQSDSATTTAHQDTHEGAHDDPLARLDLEYVTAPNSYSPWDAESEEHADQAVTAKPYEWTPQVIDERGDDPLARLDPPAGSAAKPHSDDHVPTGEHAPLRSDVSPHPKPTNDLSPSISSAEHKRARSAKHTYGFDDDLRAPDRQQTPEDTKAHDTAQPLEAMDPRSDDESRSKTDQNLTNTKPNGAAYEVEAQGDFAHLDEDEPANASTPSHHPWSQPTGNAPNIDPWHEPSNAGTPNAGLDDIPAHLWSQPGVAEADATTEGANHAAEAEEEIDEKIDENTRLELIARSLSEDDATNPRERAILKGILAYSTHGARLKKLSQFLLQGCTVDTLESAFLARESWNAEYGGYRNWHLSWVSAVKLADSFHGLPTGDELYARLDELSHQFQEEQRFSHSDTSSFSAYVWNIADRYGDLPSGEFQPLFFALPRGRA